MGDDRSESGNRRLEEGGAASLDERGRSDLCLTVRTSARARRVRLVMSARQGLVVVIPRGFDRRAIPEILERNAAWIERTANRLGIRDVATGAERRMDLLPPDRIELGTPAEVWLVEYTARPSLGSSTRPRCVVRERPGNRLVVHGDVEEPGAWRAAIERWLRRKARAVLVPRLLALAEERGFAVAGVSVRCQRSRWASCSRRAVVSLNVKLLFLPEYLTDYVLLHELCHTRRMDHSPKFWALMNKCDPDCRHKARQVRDAGRHVPGWFHGEAPHSLARDLYLGG